MPSLAAGPHPHQADVDQPLLFQSVPLGFKVPKPWCSSLKSNELLQAGIRITLTMTNHWPEYGGFAWYTKEVLGSKAAPELFYSNGRVIEAFQTWVRCCHSRHRSTPQHWVAAPSPAGGHECPRRRCGCTALKGLGPKLQWPTC